MNSQIPLLELVNISSWDEILTKIRTKIRNGVGFSLATMNMDHLVKMIDHKYFLSAYKQHDFVVSDSKLITYFLKYHLKRTVDTLPGSDMVLPLIELATEESIPIILVGSTNETLIEVQDMLGTKFPDACVVYACSPSRNFDPMSKEASKILETISQFGPALCFVAMGAPKQEVFSDRGRQLAPNVGFVSVGAGLDFLAGTQKRAPLWIRQLCLESLWRMATNPIRLSPRYVKCARAAIVLYFSKSRV